MNAQEIIAHLKLVPHPEGGHYRETFRDPLPHAQRSHSTAIYFLLQAGEISRWHRIDSAEVFHFYAGAPLELTTLLTGKDGELEVIRTLGNNFAKGEQPQLVVDAGQWQSARSLGDYSLVGCTVSPGFVFEHFEMK